MYVLVFVKMVDAVISALKVVLNANACPASMVNNVNQIRVPTIALMVACVRRNNRNLCVPAQSVMLVNVVKPICVKPPIRHNVSETVIENMFIHSTN